MKKTVIIYGHAAFQRNLLRASFTGGDYEVVLDTGKTLELLKKAAELKPDAVFADFIHKEPGDNMTFADIAAKLRETVPDVKLILVLENGHTEAMCENYVREYGADGYIKKPFQKETLAKVLDDIFNA